MDAYGKAGNLLISQLRWFIRLRWTAGACVCLFAAIDRLQLNWYTAHVAIFAVGLTILAYNALMLLAMRRLAARRQLLLMAWAQIILDLAALTVLATLTGGIATPLAGFFVFHMIFAGLLLPRRMAWASAATAVVMMGGAMAIRHRQMPLELGELRLLAGWVAALLLTVYLANHITRSLRRQRSRLIRQNRRIRRLSRQTRRQREVLMRQEKMAALGQMAAGITHEIANPLASMDTLLQLLQRKPERVGEHSLKTLRDQIARLNQIVRQMTTFAHPGAGHWETLPVNAIVDAAVEMLHFDKRLQSVKVTREYDGAAGVVRVMPQAIQQVLINLIANSLDAMAQTAAPELRLRTAREGKFWAIAVIDNGHGIPPENMNRLFEPFFTTKPVGKGTGLGLSISYNLVEKQGGELRAKSRPEGGTIFTIRLPAAE